MIKLFSLLASLLANIDKAHDRITVAYETWSYLYGQWVRIRGTAPAPAPVPAAAPVPVAVTPPVRPFPYPAPVAPAPEPAPAELPAEAYNAEGAEALRAAEEASQMDAAGL